MVSKARGRWVRFVIPAVLLLAAGPLLLTAISDSFYAHLAALADTELLAVLFLPFVVWVAAFLLLFSSTGASPASDSGRQAKNLPFSTLDLLVDGVITIDDRGGICSFNPAAERIFGYCSQDIVGRNVSALMSKTDAASHDAYIHNYVETGEQQIIGIGRETAGRRKDGSIFPMFLSVSEAPDSTAGDCGWKYIGTIQDITRRKRTEEALRVTQNLSALGRLTSGISHEFNNVLTIISGNLALLTEDLKRDADRIELVEEAQKAASRGSDLTSRLQKFSTLSTDQQAIIDVNQVVALVADLMERVLTSRYAIELQLDEGVWDVTAVNSDFESAIINLIINARDAMPEGGKITIKAQNLSLGDAQPGHQAEVRPGDYVVTKVSDTGVGIQPENLDKIFEPFFTTKEVGKGMGLGLSTVYSFAERSGGHLEVQSDTGRGTSILIYLPRREPADQVTPDPCPDEKNRIEGGEIMPFPVRASRR